MSIKFMRRFFGTHSKNFGLEKRKSLKISFDLLPCSLCSIVSFLCRSFSRRVCFKTLQKCFNEASTEGFAFTLAEVFLNTNWLSWPLAEPEPQKLCINMGGFRVHPPRRPFPYPPSGSFEKVILVIRNEYKIHEKVFWDTFQKFWVREKEVSEDQLWFASM